MKEGVLKSIFAAIGGALAWLFGGVDAVLITLGVFMAVDYATGFINAAINKTLNSSVGFKGLARKGMILFMVVIAAQADKLLGQNILRPVVCMFYIANEGISIIENAALLGVPVPDNFLKFFEKLKGENAAKLPDEIKGVEQKPPNAQ